MHRAVQNREVLADPRGVERRVSGRNCHGGSLDGRAEPPAGEQQHRNDGARVAREPSTEGGGNDYQVPGTN
jgi:hypothetical protein